MRLALRCLSAAVVAAFGITSCAPGATSGGALPQGVSLAGGVGSKYIQHVVIVVQENRSFDNFFATFPGADGAKGGCMKPLTPALRLRGDAGQCPSGDKYVPLKRHGLVEKCDFGHNYFNFGQDYDGGKMDGFGLENGCGGHVGRLAYQYVNPSQIKPYWAMASQYVLADHMFQTQGSGSFTAHQDLIAGATFYNASQTESLVDFPTQMPWGCDAPASTTTPYLLAEGSKLKVEQDGPFPCMSYATLRDLLDAKSVSWKYYSPPEPHGTGALWNAFDAIQAVREGPEWKTNVANTNVFFSDVSGGTLPAVSWIIPDDVNSDHPAVTSDTGPSWVTSIVNTIGESSYWDSTAIVILWDDWGGLYDHEKPPFLDHWGGLGFRVPMIVVSAYARETSSSQPGYISHTQYEFGSILKFIEDLWDLGRLNTTDKRAATMIDCFDFSQPARKFTAIASKYSKSFFLHQRPSYKPVDTE